MITCGLHHIELVYPETIPLIVKEYERYNGFVPYEHGYIYMMQACGTRYYKIGKTTNPDRRLLQIAPQMPFTTRFIRIWRSNFMSMAERWMHEHLEAYRANGEWFELPDKIRDGILACVSWEYDETIRHTYGSVFINNITRGNREFLLEFSQWVSEQTSEVIYPCTSISSPWLVAWIDDLFQTIEARSRQLPEDIQQEYDQRLHIKRWMNKHTSDQGGES